MDDLKLFAKDRDQIDSLVNTVRIFSEDIRMEFGLSKCGVLITERGKVVESDGLRMPDGAMMRNIEESGYKYLGVLEMDGIKHDQMKDQVRKEYTRRVRNTLKSKLNGGNIISAINSRAASVVSLWPDVICEGGARNTPVRQERLRDQLLNTDHTPQYDGGRGLLGVEDRVQAEVNSLDKYLRASEENMMKEVNSSILENKKHRQSREDIQKRNLRKRVYGEDMDSNCRVCSAAEETVAHIVSECQKLAQKEYQQVIRWKLSCPFDTRIEKKEEEKCNNYCDL
ncbi:uncharacterized protein [Penaeus vannamei]|uniref:uncharacterized protein n=1 Tax=Penaeus vannamei TaxID=6689 RepID=UPI00387FA69D